jgi:hypothetical protein
VLVNGSTATGYLKPAGADWGTYDNEGSFVSSIDSYGATHIGSALNSRKMQIPIIVTGSTASTTNRITGLATLTDAIKAVDTFGGILKFRPENGSSVVSWNLEAARVEGELHGKGAELGSFIEVTLVFVVPPTGSATLDVFDDFSVDTLGTAGVYNSAGADYTVDAGTITNYTVSGGVLDASANLTTETRYIHTGTGLTLADAQVTLKHNPGAIASTTKAGVILKRVDASNYLEAYVDDTGAASRLRIDIVIATVRTNLSSTALTRLVAGTTYWIKAAIEGNVVRAEHWLTNPTPLGTADGATATPVVLSAAQLLVLGAAIKGRQGIVLSAGNSTNTYADDFRVQGYTYRNWSLPDVLPMNGSIVGDVDAQADITVTATGSSAPAAPNWACFAWMPTPPVYNYIHNSGFETDVSGWSVAAVAGVTGAATSITRVTTAGAFYEGAASGQVVTPATANTGATFALYRRFKAGVLYTAECYVRSAAGTTNTRVRLGVSADIASETPAALSATFTRRTVTWTPTADVDAAYFCFEQTAATATTFQVDRVMVYEGATAPTFTYGGELPFGVINGASCDYTNTGAFFSTAPASDATYRSGFKIAGTGSMTTTATAEWYLQPWALTPDDYARGEIAVQVYARLNMASTQAAVNIVTSLKPEGGTSYGAERFTQEWGTAGRYVATPTAGVFRLTHLGTLVMRVDRTRPVRWKLKLNCTNDAASTGAFGIDHLVCVPARRMVSSITGVANADFAAFISSTSQTTKTVKWNKRAETSNPASNVSTYPYPDGGLGGSNILLPSGNVQVLAWLADYCPDRSDSNAAGAGKSVAATVGVNVRPQYAFARA